MAEKITDETTMDRISQLPERIIHDIMSLLPIKDLNRFSTVSSRFFSAYHSSPIIDFDFEAFTNQSTNSFLGFVASKLSRRRLLMNNISDTTTACNLQRLSFVGPVTNTNLVDEMVSFADDNKIKELNLHVKSDSVSCQLSNRIFSFNCITSLKIKGLELDCEYLILCCPSIRELSFGHCSALRKIELKATELKHPPHIEINLNNQKYSLKYLELIMTSRINVDDEWFRDNVSVCNLLETLKLEGCKQLKNVYMESDNLKTLELKNCAGLNNVDVMAPNLETFVLLHGTWLEHRRCKINIGNSMNLKHLKLSSVEVTDQWFKDNLYLFHYLEDLELEACNKLEEINIYDTVHLRSFKLLECRDLTKFEIDAPKLASLVYKGKILPSFPVVKACWLDAKLFFNERAGPIDIRHRLLFKEFLVSFGHCKTLFIDCTSEELIYPKTIREIMVSPLYGLKHLKEELKALRRSIVELIEGLLWFVPHPETISLMSRNSQVKSLRFHYNTSVKVEDEFCCKKGFIQCWRHSVTDVEMENFKDGHEKSSVLNFLIENTMTNVNVICV
ncbi:hypothetical protein FNV43_RR13530 [Rhamnella rubrinervis]|uniref:F-box domain-containing protein n=1 Tax=Rhamnella rubrinervis TaxID=2594499 RepID=A0A8K0MFB7_9ROSA|nr:hypothetical protein FNV43_RR13530 [Rhamnella rubrinervis]